MSTVVGVCQYLRNVEGLPSLSEFGRRNHEHQADQLGAIMGLRYLFGQAWKCHGDEVDTACVAAYEASGAVGYTHDSVNTLVHYLGLATISQPWWEYAHARVQIRRRTTRRECHEALYRV